MVGKTKNKQKQLAKQSTIKKHTHTMHKGSNIKHEVRKEKRRNDKM